MTPDHVATVLATLGASYRTAVSADMAEVWYEHFVDVPDAVATLAIEMVVRDEPYFPSPAVFRRYVPQARREVNAEAARHAPAPPVCRTCGGDRWYEGRGPVGTAFPRTSYTAVRPCADCAPVEYTRWRTHVADMAARRRAAPDEVFDFDPTDMLATTRRALKALADAKAAEETDA